MAGPDFGKMVGPLPLGAWFAVVGGSLGFAIYSRRQTGSAPAAASADPTMVPSDTSGVPGVGTGGSGQWTDLTPPPAGSSGSVATAPTTNEEWGRVAINYLIAQGYDANVSDSAVRKYLGLESMSAQEYTLVNEALRKLGTPPQLLPPPIFAPPTVIVAPTPIVNNPPPVVQNPSPLPSIRYYYVKPGNTLWGIAKSYYNNANDYTRIYNANRYGTKRSDGTMGMIRNPNLILIGWKLIIP